MDTAANTAQIMDEYRVSRGDFFRLEGIVAGKLERLVKDVGVRTQKIEHRVKSEESLMEKLSRADGWYQDFDQITDILGLRVICYFSDEIDVIGRAIESAFDVDFENSVDKRALIQANSFGYLSLHYVCSLREEEGWPEDLAGLKFEVQIRTMLQHAWSDIEHDLGYKSEVDVPRAVVRGFSRVAGLLELADDEFVRLRDKMNRYTQSARTQLIENRADHLPLDVVTLSEYLIRNPEMRAFLDSLSESAGAEIDHVNPTPYIAQLNWFSLDTIGELHTFFERNKDLALKMAKDAFEGHEPDILSSSIALRYLCRAELIRRGADEDTVTEFLSLSIHKKDRARERARWLIKTYGLSAEDREKLGRARAYARGKHEEQFRIGGAPYISHPEAVAKILKDEGYPVDYLIAGLFHDLLEDTDADEDEIFALGGEDVLRTVRLLTKEKGYDKDDYVSRIRKDPMARAVKAADRLHNLRTAVEADAAFQEKYIRETQDYYLDFSDKIPEALDHLVRVYEGLESTTPAFADA